MIFRFITGLLDAVPMLRAMVEDQTAEAITLTNRVVIEIHTASFRVTRGYSFAAVLADETAFWRNEDSTNPDVEIFRALRPGLASIPGAMLLNASSPYRRTGVLHEAYARHFGRDDARVLVWQAPTLAMNPTLDPSVVERAYEDDPVSASAEFGAEFRTDIADFISRAIVEACDRARRLRAPAVALQALRGVRRREWRERQRQHDARHRALRGRHPDARRHPRASPAILTRRCCRRVRCAAEGLSRQPGRGRQVGRRLGGRGVPQARDHRRAVREAQGRHLR